MTGQLTLKSQNAYTDNAWQTTGFGFLDVSNTRTGWLGVGGNGTDICDFWLANDKGDVSLRPGANGKAKVADAVIVTATRPQEINIPFQSGWQPTGVKATYCKSQEGVCVVNCAVYGTGIASSNFIATLPVGFRPSATVCGTAHAYKNGIRGVAEVQIAANGDIVIYSAIEFDYISFVSAFVAYN
ncbi:hypothetical protein [Candidatus Agathobaculum pullicola]|uniref:hypothetical protein n=1 Tax=Candidatus Agathobaculum pullicola TaxID=2838426 RepID=UPI003F8F63AE